MECIICGKTEGILVVVSHGVDRIIQCSVAIGDNIEQRLATNGIVRVHENCRKNYTRRVPSTKEKSAKVIKSVTSSNGINIDLKKQCIFCGKVAIPDTKHPSKNIHKVQNLQFLEKIRSIAKERNDGWGEAILLRLSSPTDQIVAEGCYHHKCCYSFQKANVNTYNIADSNNKKGRPTDRNSLDSFKKLCAYLEENDECQFTLSALVEKMQEFDHSAKCYDVRYLKKKLVDHFGDSITFTESIGHRTLVCFSGFRDKVLTKQFYEQKQQNEIDERRRIVLMAAKIVREDIRSRSYCTDQYPSADEIKSGGAELVPESLTLLINNIVLPTSNNTSKDTYEKKSLAIQHFIISAVRPRSFISPIQMGISVYLHRKFGSRLAIDVLSNLGVCCTYKEVTRYESAAAQFSTADTNGSGYAQFVFDNADYNIHTLDGHDTFHAMGGIKCITPSSSMLPQPPIPRVNSIVATNSQDEGYMKIIWYKQPTEIGLSNIIVKNLSTIHLNMEPDSALNTRMLNALWRVVFVSDNEKKPGWSGFMLKAHESIPFHKSALVPLPFIDHSPSDKSTIYTALMFAANEGKKLKQSKVFVTFDQPLCHKAYEILAAAPPDSPLKTVEVRLGGFHLLMSYLGAVGKIMDGSGLAELWGVIYAKNSVPLMICGRQYSRAVRAHILTQQALTRVIFEACPEKELLSDSLEDSFSDIVDGNLDLGSASDSRDIQTVFQILTHKMTELAKESRTAKLWIQYFEQVEIMKMFIKAERAGDWDLHLYCVQLMLPYFHAAGHLNYAKTAHIYLQRMIEVRAVMPQNEVDSFIKNSFFTVKRTDKFWSGTWTDMVIEQYLMRAIKSAGGLTRGRGLTSSTASKWVKTAPVTSEIIQAVENLSKVKQASSDQHVELRDARICKDVTDSNKLFGWLQTHNPFLIDTPHLISLHNGIVADSSVNCDEAREVGNEAMARMIGKPFSDVHLRRKDAVTTLNASSNRIKVKDEVVEIDSTQLFHRMICVVQTEEELKVCFSHELSAWPTSLFENCLMRKGSGKSTLVHYFETFCKPESRLIQNDSEIFFVIDGGYLLHKCCWQNYKTFSEILKSYTLHVTKNYGTTNVTVIFDGYDQLSVKDYERALRGWSSEVIIEENTVASMTSDIFLKNPKNKNKLITLLTKHLEAEGVAVFQAESDADVLIVTHAIQKAQEGRTSVVVGEDTDLIALLVYHSQKETFMLVPEKGNRPRKVYSSKRMKEELGDMVPHLLFIHAFTGCDTTSAIHGKGKVKPFEVLKKDKALQEIVKVFNDKDSSKETIANAGEAFMCAIYGGGITDRLDELRYRSYVKLVGKQKAKAALKLSALPPTSEAAKQHSFRVFFQVMTWHCVQLDQNDWGWKIINGTITPLTSIKEPAPENILKLITCNCKKGCERRHCVCMKNGLKCSDMCGHCSGFGCSNRPDAIEESESDVLPAQ